MKKVCILMLLAASSLVAKAGLNIQLHYDLGKDREYVTTTIENFTPDKYGSTFFFVDMDYNAGKQNGVSASYWEIARGIKAWEAPFEAHVEYNGGLTNGLSFDNAYLFGANYNWNSSDFSKILSLQAMYKYIDGTHQNSFQLTGVWDLTYFNGKFTCRGFADFWKEDHLVWDNDGNESEAEYIFLAEPQFWYNVTKKFALGSEIEIGNNFAGVEGLRVNPTLAAKYIF